MHPVRQLRSALAVAVLAAASPAFAATILIDNTANGSATIGTAQSFSSSNIEQGLLFTVATGYTLSITSVKVYIAGGESGFDITLWDPAVGALGSDTVINTGTGWRDFTLTHSVFSNLGSGQYRLSLGSAVDLGWFFTSPGALPTAATGLTVDGYQFSSDSGTSWFAVPLTNAIQINGMLTASAIPGSGLAAIGTLGLAGIARRRR